MKILLILNIETAFPPAVTHLSFTGSKIQSRLKRKTKEGLGLTELGSVVN